MKIDVTKVIELLKNLDVAFTSKNYTPVLDISSEILHLIDDPYSLYVDILTDDPILKPILKKVRFLVMELITNPHKLEGFQPKEHIEYLVNECGNYGRH